MNTASKNQAPFAEGAYGAPSRSPSPPAGASHGTSPPDALAVLRAEVQALRGSVSRTLPARDVMAQLEQLHLAVRELVPPPPRTRAITVLLDRSGIEGQAASQLRGSVAATLKDKGNAKTEADVADAWRDAIGCVSRVAPWPLANAARGLVTVIGPTGVGKTTTSAKLAARAIMAGRSVTLVACDDVRVGAVHQLNRYAELMGARFATALNGADVHKVVLGLTTDLVILDTGGSPTTDGTTLGPLGRLGGKASRRVDTLLCVPACVRANDAVRIARVFSRAAATALCVTKLDETDAPAGLLHAAVASGLPISTLCTGPDVPDDIAPATSGAILDALLGRSRS